MPYVQYSSIDRNISKGTVPSVQTVCTVQHSTVLCTYCIVHTALYKLHCTYYIVHPTSYILHRTTDKGSPTAPYIRHFYIPHFYILHFYIICLLYLPHLPPTHASHTRRLPPLPTLERPAAQR